MNDFSRRVLFCGYLFAFNLTSTAAESVAVQVVAGTAHSCALSSFGSVKCWGHIDFGNGKVGPIPTEVPGLSTGIVALASGASHTCALTKVGAVKCWGSNLSGELGNKTKIDSQKPVEVIGFSKDVIGIAAGWSHTCAVTKAGAVKCWGHNGAGQLGFEKTIEEELNGLESTSTVPVQIAGLSSSVREVTAGMQHRCALLEDSTVRCWGWNSRGQLGNGTTERSTRPVRVQGLADVKAISAGLSHTCAVTKLGGIKCWGMNAVGELGNNDTTNSETPVDVYGLSKGVTILASGLHHNCAILDSGRVKCWGHNTFGQLGYGGTQPGLTPVEVNALPPGVTSIAGGISHTCAVTRLGGVMCWGANSEGELGKAGPVPRFFPEDVAGFGKEKR